MLLPQISCSVLHKKAEKIGCLLLDKGRLNTGDHVALLFPPGTYSVVFTTQPRYAKWALFICSIFSPVFAFEMKIFAVSWRTSTVFTLFWIRVLCQLRLYVDRRTSSVITRNQIRNGFPFYQASIWLRLSTAVFMSAQCPFPSDLRIPKIWLPRCPLSGELPPMIFTPSMSSCFLVVSKSISPFRQNDGGSIQS